MLTMVRAIDFTNSLIKIDMYSLNTKITIESDRNLQENRLNNNVIYFWLLKKQ